MGTSTATAEGAGLCTKSAVAQADRACKSLQEVGHGQVPDMLSKGDGQARDGRVPHVQSSSGRDTALLWPGGNRKREVCSPKHDGIRPTRVVAEHESRLGNVVGEKCPLVISMRSQSGSITGVHVVPNNLA